RTAVADLSRDRRGARLSLALSVAPEPARLPARAGGVRAPRLRELRRPESGARRGVVPAIRPRALRSGAGGEDRGAMTDNPYGELDDHCFWARAMSAPAPGQIDPMVGGTTIAPDARIATMGSCFAQHLSAHLQASGLGYFIAEPAPPELDA